MPNTCSHRSCRTTAPCRLRGLPAVYRVAEFVKEHHMRVEVRDGVVWAEEVATAADSARVVRQWVPVGTTVADARKWLGY